MLITGILLKMALQGLFLLLLGVYHFFCVVQNLFCGFFVIINDLLDFFAGFFCIILNLFADSDFAVAIEVHRVFYSLFAHNVKWY